MRTSVVLHSKYAVPKHLDPAILEGREVLPYLEYYEYADQKTAAEIINYCDVIVENGNCSNIGRISTYNSMFRMDKGPDGVQRRKFSDAIQVVSKTDPSKPFSVKGDGGKLVTTLDGKVVGIIVAGGSNDGIDTTFVTPAYAFIEPPPEHVREILKGKFNIASFEGQQVSSRAENNFQNATLGIFADRPDKRSNSIKSGYTSEIVEIDGRKYVDVCTINSQYQISDGSDTGLKEAYQKGLFSRPEDFGKVIFAKAAAGYTLTKEEEGVVGVVVGQEDKFIEGHGVWQQTTYVCSAHDLVIP